MMTANKEQGKGHKRVIFIGKIQMKSKSKIQ